MPGPGRSDRIANGCEKSERPQRRARSRAARSVSRTGWRASCRARRSWPIRGRPGAGGRPAPERAPPHAVGTGSSQLTRTPCHLESAIVVSARDSSGCGARTMAPPLEDGPGARQPRRAGRMVHGATVSSRSRQSASRPRQVEALRVLAVVAGVDVVADAAAIGGAAGIEGHDEGAAGVGDQAGVDRGPADA